MEKIKGLIDAPFTPFHEDGSLNLAPIPEYAALLARNRLKGVFINGSSGEGYMLTEEERMQLAEAWMAAVPEDFKVIVHVGSTSVMSSRRLAEHAQQIGAWGIGAMATPFPKIGNIEQLCRYCEEIASAAPELPFYYYHIPAFNGAFLSMYDFLKAVDSRIPNFAGIKYTFESLYEYNRCRRYQNGKFDMLHGQDETILPCLAMGGAQVALVAPPTTMVVASPAFSKHGRKAISKRHVSSKTSHKTSLMSSVISAATSWVASAS